MEIIPVLVNIRSVHNVASIFRTADGAGCKKIVLTGFTPSPYDRFGKLRKDFEKVALGAEKSIITRAFVHSSSALNALKKQGFFIVGLEQDKKSIPHDNFKKIFPAVEKIALVLGNEPEGIPEVIRKKLDAMIEIPMRGKKESLNVSVAFGIAVYEITKE
jgi:tRNA G18 (ribose-2'-O)-methylase SpoU